MGKESASSSFICVRAVRQLAGQHADGHLLLRRLQEGRAPCFAVGFRQEFHAECVVVPVGDAGAWDGFSTLSNLRSDLEQPL
jgi:hypothetical protein